MLGPLLHQAHICYQHRVMIRTFVDDAVIRVEGTASHVTDTLIEAGIFVGHKMQHEANLTRSDKTVVIASAPWPLARSAASPSPA
eukprot:3331907-Pyramimonas_sp.AAC.1